MNVFCRKILLFIIPILLFLGSLELLLRKYDTSSPAFQAKFYQEHKKDSLDGLAFGPSHLWRGLNPEYLDSKVATFALFGSAPNVDILLCKKMLEETSPRFIILDLSQGYLQKHHTNDWIHSRKLGYYFGLGKVKKLRDLFLIDYPLLPQLLSIRGEVIYNNYGFPKKVSAKKNIFNKLNYEEAAIKEDLSTKIILEKHNIIDTKYIKPNTSAYKEVISLAKSKNIKIFFVSTPKYSIYNNGLPKEFVEQRDKLLNDFVDNKTIFFFNFEKLFEDNPNYFLDINHLNPKGAGVFTKELNTTINRKL